MERNIVQTEGETVLGEGGEEMEGGSLGANLGNDDKEEEQENKANSDTEAVPDDKVDNNDSESNKEDVVDDGKKEGVDENDTGDSNDGDIKQEVKEDIKEEVKDFAQIVEDPLEVKQVTIPDDDGVVVENAKEKEKVLEKEDEETKSRASSKGQVNITIGDVRDSSKVAKHTVDLYVEKGAPKKDDEEEKKKKKKKAKQQKDIDENNRRHQSLYRVVKSGILHRKIDNTLLSFIFGSRWSENFFTIDPLVGVMFAKTEKLIEEGKGTLIPFSDIQSVSLIEENDSSEQEKAVKERHSEMGQEETSLKSDITNDVKVVHEKHLYFDVEKATGEDADIVLSRSASSGASSSGESPTKDSNNNSRGNSSSTTSSPYKKQKSNKKKLKKQESAEALSGITTFDITLKKSVSRKYKMKNLTLQANGKDEAIAWVHHLQDKINVRANVYSVGHHGEFPENVAPLNVKTDVAICFSGGGGRAHVTTSAQLRVLHHLGLLSDKKINYISCVSASSWASGIYTFYEDGAKDDDELFGPLLSENLSELTMEKLNEKPCPLANVVTDDMWKKAKELIWTTPPHQLWEKVLSKVYLKPFGLHKEVPFCRKEDLKFIRKLNPQMTNVKFHCAKEHRPFWVCNGTIIGPDWARVGELLPIQFTPLYSGSPYLHKIHYNERRKSTFGGRRDVLVGGGMIDTFAFGGPSPEKKDATKGVAYKVHKDSNKIELLKDGKSTRDLKKAKSYKTNNKKGSQGGGGSSLIKGDDVDKPGKVNISPYEALGPQFVKKAFNLAKTKLTDFGNEIRNEFDAFGDSILKKGKIDMNDYDDDEEAPEDHYVVIKQIRIPHADVAFSLSHALGISSDAPSVNLHDKRLYNRLNTQETYWSPTAATEGNTVDGMKFDFGDGGSLDNTGLLPMLQRKVKRCIVFINTFRLLPVRQREMTKKKWRHRKSHNKKHHSKSRRGSVKAKEEEGKDEELGSKHDHKIAEVGALSQHRHRELHHNDHPDFIHRFFSFSTVENSDGIHKTDSNSSNHRPSVKRSISEPVQELDEEGNMNNESSNTFNEDDLEDEFSFEDWPNGDILPLFGIDVTGKLKEVGNYEHNHVFPRHKAKELLHKMQDKWDNGEPILVKDRYEVQANPFWGIEGGWDVEILWWHLEDSSEFRLSLPQDVRDELERGLSGEFGRFPNFKTFGQRKDKYIDVSLSVPQINLLAAYSEWAILKNKDMVMDFINNVPDDLKHQKKKKKKKRNVLAALEMEGFA